MASKLAAALLLLTATLAGAVDVAPTPDEFLIPQLAVAIDGGLGEWDLDARGYVIDPERAGDDPAIWPKPTDPANPLTSASDLSAVVALAWDETNLYVAGRVRDDDLRGIKPGSAGNVGPAGWFCDSVMLQIHSFAKPLTTNSPFTASPNLNLRYEVPDAGRGRLIDERRGELDRVEEYWKLTEHSTLATRETADGYVVEAAIPWADFDYVAQAGDSLRACFLLGDIDTGEKLTQLGWNFGEPRERPVFRLLGRPEATALLSLSTARPEAGKRWSVRYQVDARSGEVTVTRMALVGEQGEVAAQEIGAAVPEGSTGSDVLTFDAMPGEPGDYEVRLEASIGGQPAVLRTATYTLRAGSEPAPMISNNPGELRHMRPDRVEHSAYEDHRRGIIDHGYIQDRSGYERYMLTHVADYLDRMMEYYLEHSDRDMYSLIIETYALYRLTGEAKYADWTRRAIDAALANQEGDGLDPHRLIRLCEVRWHVWQNDPDTQLAPPDAEERFARAWARVATEHDAGWMFSEWGYHNRCWHRLCVAKLARHFAEQLGEPVAPGIVEYIDWHQPKFDQFGYCTDNSANYHWVGFRYPVWWNMALGTLEELAEHEELVAAMSRWRRYSSPSGAVPNFGDTSGWNTGAGSAMAYYELMSTLTGDGKYRWQAHRIAEYNYNHFWPRHDQYHGPRDFTAVGFCRAWLFAEDRVPPQAPSRASTVTFRTRVVDATPEDEASRPGWSGAKMVDEQVPDKLILTSGNDPQRLWALVELMAKGGHCGELPGHIATLMVHDSALLAGQGYYERSQDFNNVVWIEDLEGLAADPRPLRTEIPRFVDDAQMTYVRVRAEPYAGLPVTSVRDIVFVKSGFMVVKDSLTFHADMKVRVGPCWQTRDLGPQCGDDWFNTYYEWIYFTGLGLGRGVHSYRNPAWDLLVKFAPREDTRVTVVDRYEDNPYRTSGTQLRQSWSGIARAGETRTFTTVLLPHPPDFDVTGFADQARIVVDDDGRTLVHATVENDNLNHVREQYWVLLQDEPGEVKAEGFESDAQLAVIQIDRNGNVRPGVMVDGTKLWLNDANLTAEARQPQAQSIYEVPEGWQ